MSISVFLSAHAIQRIDERILQTDLKIMEILKKINESFSTGILVEPKHFVSRKEGGESARIYFPGFSFVFVVEIVLPFTFTLSIGLRYIYITCSCACSRTCSFTSC